MFESFKTHIMGNFRSLEDLRTQGKKMKRVAYGFAKANPTFIALITNGAVAQGRAINNYADYVSGVTAEGKAFVFEYERSGPTSLYVER